MFGVKGHVQVTNQMTCGDLNPSGITGLKGSIPFLDYIKRQLCQILTSNFIVEFCVKHGTALIVNSSFVNYC